MKIRPLYFLAVIWVFLSCQGAELQKPSSDRPGSRTRENQDTFRFLFMGHTYDWAREGGNKVDQRIESADLSGYDGIWLGGDVCSETTLDHRTMQYLDGLFDLNNPRTHFALGNHDYRNGNLDFYYQATKRPDFYTSTFKNLVVSVINSNLNSSRCQRLNAQFEMLESVTDTIQNASYYVLLMHHQIFKSEGIFKKFKSNGDLDHYSMNCDSVDSYFETSLYPRLVDIQKKGVQVIVVVGDSGWSKSSEVVTPDGLVFLASGINNSYYLKNEPSRLKTIDRDRVLEFVLVPEKRVFAYTFIPLNEL